MRKYITENENILIFIILILGGIVRLWGIGFGLPHTSVRPDENTIIKIALKFGSGDLNPHFYSYPSLYMYMLFFLYVFYFLFGRVCGIFSSISDFIVVGISNPTAFFLIDRIFSAIMGTATIYVVYLICKRLFDKNTALASATLLSLAYLHVRDSHFGVTDITMTLFVMLAIYLTINCLENDKKTAYATAGFVGGLATSIKYNGALLIIPLLLVYLINKRMKISGILYDGRFYICCFSFLFAFLLGSPFILLDSKSFIAGFLFEANHLNVGHGGMILGKGWVYHSIFSLPLGLGFIQFIFGILGIITCFLFDKRKAMVLFIFPLLYYFFIGKGNTVFLRYMLPLIPFLCIGAAYFVIYLGKIGLKRYKLYLPIILFALLIPSIHNIISFDALISKRDNRLIAADWINENINAGSSIYSACSIYGEIKFYPRIDLLNELYGESSDAKMKISLKKAIDSANKLNIKLYNMWEYDAQNDHFKYKGKITNVLPKYVILEKSPLSLYSKVPKNIQVILKSKYHLKRAFIAINVNNSNNLFDQLDAFYVPYVGFKSVERPGPNIEIYEINQ